MIDRRELILKRVVTLLEDTEGVETVARNRGLLDNDKLPAVILLDGDESADKIGRVSRGGMAPTINRMRPEIYILLKDARPPVKNDGAQGTALNNFRMLVCEAIANDAELNTLLGSNGSQQYLGCTTDLKSGGSLSGQMRIDIALSYAFDPTLSPGQVS